MEGLAEQADDRFVPASFPTQERTGSYRAGPAPISAMSGVQGWLGDSPVVRRNHSIAVLPLSLNEPGDVYYAASLYRLTLIVSHRMPLEANGQYLAYFGVCQS